MSAGYKAVQWNRNKIWYDAILIMGVAAYIWSYRTLAPMLDPNAEAMNVRIRAYGSAAFVLLHLILSIGPLCRLDRRFLPLLYNRRHMGVTMSVLALLHTDVVVTWYHDYSPFLEPWVSVLVSNTRVDSLVHFPFEFLGLGALLIFLVMAATSHDFWLHNLSAPIWKRIHMLVYLAYFLLVGHVVLGALQSNTGVAAAAMTMVGMVWVLGVHGLAAFREHQADQPSSVSAIGEDRLIDVGPALDIPNFRAKVVFGAGERIAVFRNGNVVSAVSSVCQHQNGPLGEGRIIDGLITCPWHGYQYEPETGASPPPFTEQVPTFRVRIEDGHALVDPRPLPPGTRVKPALIEGAER